jgi:flagellar hook assembly protein FlgD
MFRKSCEPTTVSVAPASTEETAQILAARLEPNTPNPFDGRTAIRFAIPSAGQATLSIYDVQGRLVRNLITGSQTAGVHTAYWDGRDDGGRLLPSGVYLYRLSSAGRNIQRKMVLTR